MSKVAIVYWSGTGNTQSMAEAVKAGAESSGASVDMFTSIEGSLSGKKVVLFGSYGWGDGQWMRDWEDRCKSDNATLVTDSVIANNAPSSDDLENCSALGRAIA